MTTDPQQLIAEAKAVLATNDMGSWTRPTVNGLYPHQWLWDSFFIAIGQRHYDIARAMDEVRSPFRAQWKNGMLPHIIFSDAKGYHAGPELWHCERSADAPDHVKTSGVTQPPMAAEAVVRIGQLLNHDKRRAWYHEMYPKLVAYHQWFYRERCPRGDGLPEIVLSWETGMDNSPPWMVIMDQQATSLRMKVAEQINIEPLLEMLRNDTSAVPAEERIDTIDLYTVYDLIRNLRRLRYNGDLIAQKHPLRIIDVTVCSILIRANQLLQEIADEIDEKLPADIQHAMRVAPHALETMWDDEAEEYFNRDAISGKLIKISSISTFMPLYTGQLPKERVQTLLKHLNDPTTYGATYPIPSAPINSPYFDELRYWKGPTWVNMNWLLIDGLRHNNLATEAAKLREKTIDMITKSGFYEYFSTFTAAKAGADTFSWTAALLIDLLSEKTS